MTYTSEAIDRCRAENHAAFIAYLTVGFPNVDQSIEAAKIAVASGADIIELGFPYSDPTMDGTLIQQAGYKAIARGMHRADMFRAVEEVAKTGAAVTIMSYHNPVLRYGVENFARDLANAGGAGMITPDLIPEEASEWIAAADEYNLDRIFLVAPFSTDERLKLTVAASRGFVYAASRMGVTGVQEEISIGARGLVQRTRQAGAERVAVGIGVSNGKQAREVAEFADGVIVGSALMAPLVEHDGDIAGLRELERVATEIAEGAHTPHSPRH